MTPEQEERIEAAERYKAVNALPPGALMVDRYKVLEFIGKGAFGFVLKVEDQKSPGRPLAAKVLYPTLAKQDEYYERFKREFDLIKQLSHPNVVKAYDLIETEGLNFFTMEFIEGVTLEHKLKERSPDGLPIDSIVDYLTQIASGLGEAHRKGIVHRDVKPENILLTPDGIIKVTDFGIGKPVLTKQQLTKPANLIGSLPFMAPEQCAEEPMPVDARTDIYGLGITAFLLATGRCPFMYPYPHLIVQAHLSSEFPKLASSEKGIPLWFDKIVRKACAKAPEDRFQNTQEFITALKTKSAVIAQREDKLASAKRNFSAKTAWIALAFFALAAVITALILIKS